MEKQYEVTIGLPVYNVEKYMRTTLDSVLAQDFESLEILLCDDCGTDASITIAEEYQQNHARGCDIRIVRQPENKGTGEARNRLIDEARGRYLYFMDADDVIEPNTISLLYNAAKKYDAQAVYGSYERIFIEDGCEVKRVEEHYPMKVFTEPDEFALYAYNVGIQAMHWNRLTDISVYRDNHLRVTPVGAGYGEDFTFTVDLPTYITRAVLLPDVTYHFFLADIATRLRQKRRTKKLQRHYMDLSVAAIDQKKRRAELKDKPYYRRRCAILMMYSFSFVCQILSRRNESQPPYTDREIRDVMWHPMSLFEILRSPQDRLRLLKSWLMGCLPSFLAVRLMFAVAKLTHRLNHFEVAK
jgi:glycosyltransferase involved in cell wall biosynthesis